MDEARCWNYGGSVRGDGKKEGSLICVVCKVRDEVMAHPGKLSLTDRKLTAQICGKQIRDHQPRKTCIADQRGAQCGYSAPEAFQDFHQCDIRGVHG